MSDYDLIIRNGTIYDGLGGAPISGDVAVRDGVIAAVGTVHGSARQEIDATHQIVTPGFVDIHTHYDGQCTWEERLIPSSNHGVTSVVMGNCGVGFAPCRPHQRDMLVKLMEGVEDIPEVVMTEGLPWNWETFPEYMNALEARRLDVDIAAQLPHSALRVFVMGERAAGHEPPTAEDLRSMRTLTAEAIHVGALGVTTSRNLLHRTKAGELAPSIHSEEAELLSLAAGLRDAGGGVFQMIPNLSNEVLDEFALMRKIAAASQRPLSFTLLHYSDETASSFHTLLDSLGAAHEAGLTIRGQVAPRPVGTLYGLELSLHPFIFHPSFQPLANLPLEEKVRAMRDPKLRARLLAEQPQSTNPALLQLMSLSLFAYPMSDPPVYEPKLEERIDKRAAALGITAHEYAYDCLLQNEGRTLLYVPAANFYKNSSKAMREMLLHPHTVTGLSDGGAHYGMICDATFPTYYLQRWARDASEEDRIPLARVVAALTSQPADAVGLLDRGRIAVGYKADLNVIDLDHLRLYAPTVVRDLPANGRRLRQIADGYSVTIASGEVTYRNGVPTGALPGRLVRGARQAPAAGH